MSELNVVDVANEVLAAGPRERAALAVLLDSAIKREGYMLAERAAMGGTESYVGTVSLDWLRANVGLASSLPLLKTKLEGERVVIDRESVELVTQRPINWERQSSLAQYLLTKVTHKFPPILAVITAGWVDDPKAPEWGKDGRALKASADFEALDNVRVVGLVKVDSESYKIYALDGQHRVIGVMGADELVRTGKLVVKDKDGKATKEVLVLEELIEEYDLEPTAYQKIGSERIGIELIPAVVQGETREEAQRRIRSIFVHVNLTAAPLQHGELAQLDEDNGFAIVARRVATEHPLLTANKGQRVNFNNSTISAKSLAVTTLQTVKDMAQRYLTANDDYAHWKAKGRLLPMRPSDEELAQGVRAFRELIDKFATLPSYMELQQGKAVAELRRFGHEKPEGTGRGHMLFRPIGQAALAQAVGTLHYADGRTLDDIFSKFGTYDAAGGFRMDDPSSLWYGVLYDFNSRRMRVRGRDLAARLLRYLLVGAPDDVEREKLRADLAEARRVSDEATRAFDGTDVPFDALPLPPVL